MKRWRLEARDYYGQWVTPAFGEIRCWTRRGAEAKVQRMNTLALRYPRPERPHFRAVRA